MTFRNRRLALALLLWPLSAVVLAAPPAKKAPPAPDGLSANAQLPVVTLPDPKYPGRLLIEAHARMAEGQSQDTGFLGDMTGVWARLYQKGVPAAVLTAPRAVGSSLKNSVVVTGTGGVVVKSLTQPGTKLTADKVVWYASLNRIVATGHVVYHDGKTGATMTGPVMNADTRLKTVSLTSGVHARMTF